MTNTQSDSIPVSVTTREVRPATIQEVRQRADEIIASTDARQRNADALVLYRDLQKQVTALQTIMGDLSHQVFGV